MNAAILAAGILVPMFSPISGHSRLPDVVDLLAALVLMVVANWFALRPLFKPLERLAGRMKGLDVLRSGSRVPVGSPGEIGALEGAFNEMISRLESERREAGARALHAQEEERRRIARGLHDEVGQTMTGVLFQLHRLARQATLEQRAEIEEAQEAVRASMEDVRRMARELRPEVLDHLGLASALTQLCRSFGDRTGIVVSRRFEPDLPELDPYAELAVYRVAQESLTNAAKHGDVGEVVLSLGRDGDGVALCVVDDGSGFDDDAVVEGGGLRGIRERALIVGGFVAIKTAETGGVEVRLWVPAGVVEVLGTPS